MNQEELNELRRAHKKGGNYSESYASSEGNVADMLAEYDSIGNEDIRPAKRTKHTDKRKASKITEAKRGHSKKKPASSTTRKGTKKSKYADAMYEAPAKQERAGEVPRAAKRKAELFVEEAPAKQDRAGEGPRAAKPKVNPTSNHKKAVAATGAGSRHVKQDAVRKHAKKSRPLTFSEKIKRWFKGLTGLDYLVAGTGVAVLVVAIVAVNMFSNAKALDKRIGEFASIGDDLSLIGTAGEGVLMAAADNRSLSLPEEEESDIVTEYNEKEDESTKTVTVAMNLQSVVKDLKIKFVNKKTNKLIAGIPFEAEVTDSNKKTTTYKDDDKDGVIYINPMQHGDTKVKLVALDGYDGYEFGSDTQSITVKETLEYKKIDVSDEIKKESQVNAAVEDTAMKEQVEAALTDTVEWVESTKTATGSTTKYTPVSASEIAKPTAITGIDWLDIIYYKILEKAEHTWVSKVQAAEGSNDPDTGLTPTPEETPAPTPTEEPTPEPTPEIEEPDYGEVPYISTDYMISSYGMMVRLADEAVVFEKNSDERIFQGANYIVTPTDKNSPDAIELCKELGRTLGFARISELTPEKHDEMIAFLSQLTHCIAVALMTANTDPRLVDYTGDSFRDLTRIARINEDMWSELFLLNKDKLVAQIDAFSGELNRMRTYLADENIDKMKEMMRISTERRALFDKK